MVIEGGDLRFFVVILGGGFRSLRGFFGSLVRRQLILGWNLTDSSPFQAECLVLELFWLIVIFVFWEGLSIIYSWCPFS